MSIKHIPYWIQYQYIKNSNKHIICESFIKSKLFWFQKNNWGDDLNKYMFEYVTGMKVVNLPINRLFFKVNKSYSLIGSILSFYSIDNKIIYGTGLMNPKDNIIGTPERIICVRGPKTRETLLNKGYICPEKYGDPALLLPLFYAPSSKRQGRGSVIVNMGTNPNDNDVIKQLCESMNLNLISLTTYNKWGDIIDEIVSSTFVISESLHGLIVAETYGVPNVWVEFKDHPEYWNFKFEDYYESIGKSEEILKLQNSISISDIEKKVCGWNKANIDYKKLLSYFPFDIKCDINKEYLCD